jgi:predicted PurR-regulated permease PerM
MDAQTVTATTVNRWPFVVATSVILALLWWALHPILTPFALGALLAYLGDPLVDRFEHRGYSRTAGVSAVFLLLTLGLILILAVGLPLLLEQADQALRRIPDIYRWISITAVPWIQGQLSLSPVQLPPVDWEAELAAHWKSMGKVTADMVAQVTRSGLGLAVTLFNLALVPVVAFYLMRDWDRMVEALLDLIPRPWQEHVSLMVAEADDVLGAFIRGQFLVMLAQAIMYSTLLWLVGIDYAVILGTLAGVAAIIPYAGSVIGIGSSIAVAWTQFGGDLSPLLWVSGVFALGQTIESWVLTPMLVGDRIGLHPVVVIFVLMAGGQLAGFTGVLVALPVAAVIFVFGRHALTYYRHSRTYQGS